MDATGTSSTRNCLPSNCNHCLFTSACNGIGPQQKRLALSHLHRPKNSSCDPPDCPLDPTLSRDNTLARSEKLGQYLQSRGFGVQSEKRRVGRLFPQNDVLLESGFRVGVSQVCLEIREGIRVDDLIEPTSQPVLSFSSAISTLLLPSNNSTPDGRLRSALPSAVTRRISPW